MLEIGLKNDFKKYTPSSLFESTAVFNRCSWSLVKESQDIKVYKRPTSKGYDAIKVQAEILTSLSEFIKVIQDIEMYPYWVYKCRRAVVLEPNAGTKIKYWLVSDFPFPFKTRELTIGSCHCVDQEGVYQARCSAMPSVEIGDQNITIRNFESSWDVTQIAERKIRILYELRMDPGGVVPRWLYNRAIVKRPFKTIGNLKNILELNNS